jgi:hypothetical protein
MMDSGHRESELERSIRKFPAANAQVQDRCRLIGIRKQAEKWPGLASFKTMIGCRFRRLAEMCERLKREFR